MSELSGSLYAAAAAMPPYERSRLKPPSTRNRTQDASSTSRWRFNRSTTNLAEPSSQPLSTKSTSTTTSSTTTSSPPPQLERTPSKMSLFNLFSRPKVERARGHQEVGLAVPMRPETSSQPDPRDSPPKSALRQNPSPSAQQSMRARSSQMFRPMSMRPTPAHKEFGSWDPPPLFQAFHQSVKHATVQACVFPPEVLMRTQSQRRQAEALRERMDNVRDLSTIAENSSEAKKLEKTHRRLISNAVLNPPTPELVNKIYILVNEGYVLQYAGDGSFDRTPEKVLQLGKESAAFACDLIPGRHWVLQISSHAHGDGTLEPGPKNTLLSRLRSQNTAVKKAATSFLLVLESAEEMDAWMTVVRKEIDSQGGMKAKDETVRASSSTDGSKRSSDTARYRRRPQRNPEIINEVSPADSPRQSQTSESPKIVTSDWETDRSVRTASITDSTSGQSSRRGTNRQSVELSSVASTPVSQHQMQLDQLRGRSRFSFMSNATTTSGSGTRNTSRDSSPAPHSPVKEDFSPTIDAETPRSAMSLKSFHMNPTTTSAAARRRSMQPLPVTNEHFPPSVEVPKRQRHSLYSPTSPTVPELANPTTFNPLPVPKKSTTKPIEMLEIGTSHIYSSAHMIPLKIQTELVNPFPVATPVKSREDSPVRSNARSYSIPPRRGTVSPPPSEPAPLPPQSARRGSIIGNMQASTAPAPRSSTTPSPVLRSQRRISATPKPFLRPFPVRPQAQHGDNTMIIPRRQSSLTPASAPAPLPLGINVNRSVTAPARPPSAASDSTPTSDASTGSQLVRRPSGQRRSDPTASRPVRAIASTPSFVPGRRSSNGPTSATRQLQPSPSSDSLRQTGVPLQTLLQSQRKLLNARQSMPAISLPPPAPPPNMPLPTLPRNLPPNLPLPPPPPNMPLPAPPPTIPLPPTPPMAASRGVPV